jgi:hypothetical protein
VKRAAEFSALTGVDFVGWVAEGTLYLSGLSEGPDALAKAYAAAAVLDARGIVARVGAVRDTRGELIFVNVDAEVAA